MDLLLRGVLAGLIGTVFMNLSSETEMHIRGRQPSVVPGRAANKMLSIVGVPQLEGAALKVLSTWTHYLYGAAWGVVLWVLLSTLELPIAAALPLFFVIVWGTEQVELPALGLTPPSWKWGAKEVAIDLGHHVVFAIGSVVGWALLGSV
jgi:uncharacterized membrane protein YagU involved in acid resistance